MQVVVKFVVVIPLMIQQGVVDCGGVAVQRQTYEMQIKGSTVTWNRAANETLKTFSNPTPSVAVLPVWAPEL